MFDFPPPQVIEVAKQNQITHVKFDKIWSYVNPYGFKVYIGKYKNSKEEECIMFDGKNAHKCNSEEHLGIFMIYR